MRLSFLAAGLAILAVPGTAFAQAVAMETIYSACFVHYGDQSKPMDVTPVMKVTAPIVPVGSTHGRTGLMLDGSYTQLLNRKGVKRYKAHCLSGLNVAEVATKLKNWESISGYGSGPKVALAASSLWPELLDELYNSVSFNRQITRSMYAATEAGKAF